MSCHPSLFHGSTCKENEFHGLSIIDKYNSVGATFPEIPIAEIPMAATQIHHIAPSEVMADWQSCSLHLGLKMKQAQAGVPSKMYTCFHGF